MTPRKPATAPRCRELLQSGEPCPNPARTGEAVCGTHGARAEADRARIAAQKEAFLQTYRESGNVTEATAAAGLKSRRTYYDWIVTDPQFLEAAEDARKVVVDKVRTALIERGVHGVPRAVWYKGNIVGSVREYDTTALIFAAKALAPNEFRERVEVYSAAQDEQVMAILKRVLTTFCRNVGLDISSPEIRMELAKAFRGARQVADA